MSGLQWRKNAILCQERDSLNKNFRKKYRGIIKKRMSFQSRATWSSKRATRRTTVRLVDAERFFCLAESSDSFIFSDLHIMMTKFLQSLKWTSEHGLTICMLVKSWTKIWQSKKRRDAQWWMVFSFFLILIGFKKAYDVESRRNAQKAKIRALLYRQIIISSLFLYSSSDLITTAKEI